MEALLNYPNSHTRMAEIETLTLGVDNNGLTVLEGTTFNKLFWYNLVVLGFLKDFFIISCSYEIRN